MSKTLSAILQLRRDNDYNYDKIKTTFVPAAGEVCLVITSDGNGTRAKIGDGTTTYENLPFSDENIRKDFEKLVNRGYFYNGQFYTDSAHTTVMTPVLKAIFIDADSSNIYTYTGAAYDCMLDRLPTASATAAGIMKLYTTTGQNTDGTMTQKSITDELNTKFKVSAESESLIFET